MNYNNPATAGRSFSGELVHPSEKVGADLSMKENFEKTLRKQTNEKAKEKFNRGGGWIDQNFDVEWSDGSDNDPVGLKFEDTHQNTRFRDSCIPGLTRVLKELGFTFVMMYDGRCKRNETERGIIVTGHQLTGGQLPQEIVDEVQN